MNVWTYDVEVLKYDWTFVAKKYKEDKFVKIHNNREALIRFMSEDPLLVGFNNKFYDNYIVKGIIGGLSNIELKELSDFIVTTDHYAWEHPYVKNLPYMYFKSTDLMSDMQLGNSLKSIEGHLGMPIVESSIPFDIDRPLTADELDELIWYNTKDVIATEELLKLRATYLNTKMKLGSRIGLPPDKALYLTNASLVAKYLKAEKQTYTDARDIFYAPTIDWNYIPKEVKDFFAQSKDNSIPYKELWKKKLDIDIAGMKTRFAWGGVHGGLKKYIEVSNKNRIIVNFDVESLYPSIKIQYNLISRSAKDKEIYAKTKLERIKFKKLKMKDDDMANKLVINIAFGATLLSSNPLYDERNGRSICVNGQLLMTDLLFHYLEKVKTLKFINYNTDGIMLSVDRYELNKLYQINEEWEKRTRLKLEETKIKKVIQKDVNNYIIIEENGKLKTKGSYLKMGVNKAGSWSINNDIIIVKEALLKYFTEGKPYADTINECNDPFKFQMIAKAGSTYKKVAQEINGKLVEVQKVNRVFASKDKSKGTLYKFHINKLNNDGYRGDKIASIPENCEIDNKMQISIDKVDKMWYIRLCESRIKDFIGGKNVTI